MLVLMTFRLVSIQSLFSTSIEENLQSWAEGFLCFHQQRSVDFCSVIAVVEGDGLMHRMLSLKRNETVVILYTELRYMWNLYKYSVFLFIWQ